MALWYAGSLEDQQSAQHSLAPLTKKGSCGVNLMRELGRQAQFLNHVPVASCKPEPFNLPRRDAPYFCKPWRHTQDLGFDPIDEADIPVKVLISARKGVGKG